VKVILRNLASFPSRSSSLFLLRSICFPDELTAFHLAESLHFCVAAISFNTLLLISMLAEPERRS